MFRGGARVSMVGECLYKEDVSTMGGCFMCSRSCDGGILCLCDGFLGGCWNGYAKQ
jgi:hypothetical protein